MNRDPLSELALNGSSLAASRSIAAVASLIAVPVVIHDLGLVQFGVWESMLAITSLSTIITGPIGATLLWRMSLACGQQDGLALRRLVRAGVAGALIVTVALLPLGFLLRSLVSR